MQQLSIYQQNTNQPFMLMQNKWASILNPFLSNPLNQMRILKDISLSIGSNSINHLLGRIQQGWIIIDIQGGASMIYRSAPFNDKILTLMSSAAVTISLGVF